jgi:flagellar biosynthesis GTPase FlhF
LSKIAPIKSLCGEPTVDKNKQLEKLVEHYSSLYSTVKPIDSEFDKLLPRHYIMTELDETPSERELSEALHFLSNGKAPGMDNIPAELLKANKDVLLSHIYELLTRCWLDGVVPYDMCNAKIITPYKNIGDKGGL